MKQLTFLLAFLAFTYLGSGQTAISVSKSGKGSPVIFLPGFTCPGSVWEETIKNLRENHTNYVVSYAGFNGTKSIDTPWYEPVKIQLIDYIRDAKLSKVIIIGHSMGGDLGIEVAAALPQQVAGLVLVESLPCMRALMMPGVAASALRYKSPYNERVLNMKDEEFKQMATGMAGFMTNTKSKVDLLTEWILKADRKTYVYGYTDLLKLDLRDMLSTIETPVLILGAAAADKKMVTSTYEKQYLNLKHKEILVADNSQHFIMFDQPEWLYMHVNKYLDQYGR